MESNRYDAYMNTESEWLGEVPEGWSVDQIASLYSLRNTKVSDSEYPPLSVTMKGIVPQLDSAAKTDAHDDRKLVCVGDFVINSRSDRRGACGISEYEGSVSLINTVMTPRNKMHPGYYNWLFHTVQFADEFYKWGHGIVDDLWTTRWQEMKKIIVPYPPLYEQEKISLYLDERIQHIEEIILEAKKNIEEYKEWKITTIHEKVNRGLKPDITLVDSGDGLIGMIPENFIIRKLKSISTIVRGGSPRPAGDERYYNGNIPFMKISDITKDDGIYVDSCVSSIKEAGLSRTRMIKANTLVLTNSGATLGIPKITTFDTTFNDGIAAFLNMDNNVMITYLYFALKWRTKYFLEYASLGMGQPNLNTDIIGNTNIVVPPLEEQEAIVNYLVEQCGKIDKLIQEKEKLVFELEEYKKALIFEVVTGKRKVV